MKKFSEDKMGHFKRVVYGWIRSNAEQYRRCYDKFGGSINMHPDVIEFVQSRSSIKIDYFHREINGEIIGAYPLIDRKKVGIYSWKKYPLSYDEVLLPLDAECKIGMPENLNRLSPFQSENYKNINYRIARKNKVCIVREKFSSKNEKNRRNEFSRFLRSGGVCVEQSFFTDVQLATFYVTLFKMRFGDSVHCYELHDMIDIIRNLRHMLFGHVLFIGDEPCAIDIIFCGESEKSIYFDVPNGGVDTRFSYLSPGSVLMWKNIHAARELCLKKNKSMRFSIGALDDSWNYKLRWADAHPTGKPFF